VKISEIRVNPCPILHVNLIVTLFIYLALTSLLERISLLTVNVRANYARVASHCSEIRC